MRALGSGPRRWCSHDIFRLIFGMGIGIGLCSVCFFVGLLTGVAGWLYEMVVLLAVATAAILRWKTARCMFCEHAPAETGRDRLVTVLLTGAVGLLLLLDVGAFVATTLRSPHGGWDAWAIWNVRARFLYRAPDATWHDAFSRILDWSHPDYPLLLPAFIARTWRLLGGESQYVPITLAGFFTFGSVGLIAASLWILRGARQGLLASLALAATPILFVQGAIQCADVPVTFFRIATLSAMAMADRFESRGFAVLAGVVAALDAWTKNEGLLWLGAFLLARALVPRARFLPAFLAGAAPVLAVILLFKARVATPSDIFGPLGRVGMLERFMDQARYLLIAKEAMHHAWTFGPLLVSPFLILAVYLAVVRMRAGNQDRAILEGGAMALMVTAAGYFLIYVLRPLDLLWLLDSSMDRLILQLWPAIVFLVFLAARSPERQIASIKSAGELSSDPVETEDSALYLPSESACLRKSLPRRFLLAGGQSR
jgi:hypothetical protein